jgi:hypothetical protein
MQRMYRSMIAVVVLLIAGLQLAACGQTQSASANKPKPAVVEPSGVAGINRVVLTEKAAQRIDIQTAQVREEAVNGAQRKVIPYAAVVYGLKGETWTYTNPAPLTFVRQPITIDYIEGDMAFLSDGPAAGTAVATVGVAELYGADTGIGK